MSSISETATWHLLSTAVGRRLPQCLELACGQADWLVLIGEAARLSVLDAQSACWTELPTSATVCVLQADLDARGIAQSSVAAHIRCINDDEWVAVSEKMSRSLSWGAKS